MVRYTALTEVWPQLQWLTETKQTIPASTHLELSEGCLARCSLSFICSEQTETTLEKNLYGFSFSVEVRRRMFKGTTTSKKSEEREHTALPRLKERSQSIKNPCFSSPFIIHRHHVHLIKIFKWHLQI